MMNEQYCRLYASGQVRELDRRAIQDHGVPGYELMCRAAASAWRAACDRWPGLQQVVVCCGGGNNGGDGYEFACLAKASGCDVRVHAIADTPAEGDALKAYQAWSKLGDLRAPSSLVEDLAQTELIVDAMLGTGLSRAPEGRFAQAIAAVNSARAKGAGVLAMDVPSGLSADTGAAFSPVVAADLTVTFIGNKLGLHTGAGPGLTGIVRYESLDVPETIFDGIVPGAQMLNKAALSRHLPPRPRDAHKGKHGHVLIVGGNRGMMGAALLAARGALRAGAGLVSVATHPDHAAAMTSAQPEVMCHGVADAKDLDSLLANADVVAVGPGLGRDGWARAMYAAIADHPDQVLDADALNLLADEPRRNDRWVLTPHPGEAARLLETETASIQLDRVAALRALADRYGGYPILKGAGSLVWTGDHVALCPFGNPGMGVGGMGDVLTGIVAALLGQGLQPADAASIGVLVHALAGDRAAEQGQRGLLPTDLVNALRGIVNP